MVTLVVLNYNDAKTVKKYIEKIKDYSSIEHIVIVDNCSTDDSYEQLKKLEQLNKISVLRAEANNGYSSGNNLGINYAIYNWNPEFIIISNPDVEFEERVVFELVNIIKDKAAVAATCKMVCTSGIEMPIAWKLPTFMDCVFENLIILKKLLNYRNTYNESDLSEKIEKVEVIPGSFFMVNATKFIEAGGFDENTFLYCEENILGQRFKEKKFEQYIFMGDSYIHKHSISINQTYTKVEQRLNLAYRSRKYYCEQYLKINNIQRLLLWITFKVGTFNYVTLKKLMNVKKGKNY